MEIIGAAALIAVGIVIAAILYARMHRDEPSAAGTPVSTDTERDVAERSGRPSWPRSARAWLRRIAGWSASWRRYPACRRAGPSTCSSRR